MAVRKSKNKDLPPNLYAGTNGHYRYRRPDTGKWYSVGKDRAKAISAAKRLNARFMKGRAIVAKVTNGNAVLFSDFLKKFEDSILPSMELAETTYQVYKGQLRYVYKYLGARFIDEISIKEIAEFLDHFPPKRANKYRSFLSNIFKYVIARGLCEDNPVEKVLRHKEQKTRRRLTLEGYFAIYNHPDAEPWFRNAMDLALQTLQRRGDIINIKFTDEQDGYLYVIQSKTEKHGAAAHLKIKIGPALRAVIDRCSDGIESPYLIHLKDNRHTRRWQSKKPHHTQLSGNYLTLVFAAIRNKLDCFRSLPVLERPTFHEIRSLGIKLYEDGGIDAQALAGHKNRAMTDKYKEGHEIQWTNVSADLSL